jgi:hypothetical protein
MRPLIGHQTHLRHIRQDIDGQPPLRGKVGGGKIARTAGAALAAGGSTPGRGGDGESCGDAAEPLCEQCDVRVRADGVGTDQTERQGVRDSRAPGRAAASSASKKTLCEPSCMSRPRHRWHSLRSGFSTNLNPRTARRQPKAPLPRCTCTSTTPVRMHRSAR